MTLPNQTYNKILKAARHLFIKQGFAGTSISSIASLAKINHSLIFHHFENKEGLWKAVKQDIVAKAKELSPTLPELQQPFSRFLKELILANINFYRNNPDIISLLNWQRLERQSDKAIGISLSKESKAWLAALQFYQDKNAINKNLKLEFVLTYILSIISTAAMDPNAFIQQKKSFDAYINFSIEMLLKSFS